MELFTQTLANGVMLGSIYALVAAGLALVFGVMDIPQFAFGAHAMIGGYLTWWVGGETGSYWLGLLVAVAALAALGVITHAAVFDQLRKAPSETLFIAAFGLVMVLQGAAQVIWGPDPRSVEEAVPGSITIAGATITYQRLIIIGVAVALFVGLHLFLTRTLTGLSVRAAAQSRTGAQAVGLRPRAVGLLAMAIGSALAGLAGALLVPISQAYPTVGDPLAIKAFVVIVLAGMGSVNGAVVGGIVLGAVEAFGAAYLSLEWRDAYPVLLLILVLVVRPQGLFGKEAVAWR
ncbi:branched-chain amino acid ABC transporter permease [Actinomadura atramentaria]|uniref:branched-chain amino acid ABC transporter permease n=1 Tax=Actinomadura atramentaria TaxID=1990 RepID=UPI00036C1776|nr:branched-chain amino acid ABC transporter permease [Actinomadura atramentaria]